MNEEKKAVGLLKALNNLEKKCKIKYQKGNDILVTELKVEKGIEPQYIFYMSNPYADIIEISEVKE